MRVGARGALPFVLAAASALSLVSPSSSAVPVLPVPPNLHGPNNGGHFHFGTVHWVKLQQQPPVIRFTVEAAFRRSFGATNFKGSGTDGRLVVGDKFKPSGLETIMFDFGDGSMLTPMMFTVEAYSVSEDWVQGYTTFDHTYATLSSNTPFEYVGTFKGCCRVSDLEVNADTSWALSTIMNVRDDMSSPRLTVLPMQTILKKQRPSDPDPFIYIPASDDTHHDHPRPKLKTWQLMGNIGHAPSIIGEAKTPQNMPHWSIDSTSGRISLAAGPVYASDSASDASTCAAAANRRRPACFADYDPATGRAATNMTNLAPGLYNLVLQLMQGNSSAPVEVSILVTAESLHAAVPERFPRLLAPKTPDIFYPHFSYARHVAYLGFPITPFEVSGEMAAQAMNLGFTTGRMPDGLRLSTVAGGTASYGFTCVNGSMYCRESPMTRSNGTNIPGCTAMPADTGKPCTGPHNSLTACRGGGICQACWHLGSCPVSMGNMTVEWIPTLGQVGTHMLCFDVTAQRPRPYCGDEAEWGCGDAISSPSQCVNIEVFKDPAPNIWSSYAEDLDPYSHTNFAYIGRTLTFTVYADDDNCKDKPAITMGPMPPGASLAPQVEHAQHTHTHTRTHTHTHTSRRSSSTLLTSKPPSLYRDKPHQTQILAPQLEHVAAVDHTVTSYFGVNDTSTTHCPTQSRVFSWCRKRAVKKSPVRSKRAVCRANEL